MAVRNLDDDQSRHHFFAQGIIANLSYWTANLPRFINEPVYFEQEHYNLIRATQFALDLTEIWEATCDFITRLTPLMERRGFWQSWYEVLGKAINTAIRLGAYNEGANLAVSFALACQQQNDFEQAKQFYRRAIQLAKRGENEFALARAYTNLGYFYTDLERKWHRALVLCCYALSLFEKINSHYGQANTHNHLGLLYIRQYNQSAAETHLRRACEIWQSMGDEHGLMRGYINYSALYIIIEDYEQAIAYLYKALHQAELSGERPVTGAIWMNMTIANVRQGNYEQAEYCATQAEAIGQQYAQFDVLAKVRNILARLSWQQQDWTKASLYLEEALTMARKHNLKHIEVKTMILWVEYELARGEQAEAQRRYTEAQAYIARHNQGQVLQVWLNQLVELQPRLSN